MKQFTIDCTFRNRNEAEQWLNPLYRYYPRWYRVAWLLFAIITIPIELVCELFIVFLGLVARIGGGILWATNPTIELLKQTTNAEEES